MWGPRNGASNGRHSIWGPRSTKSNKDEDDDEQVTPTPPMLNEKVDFPGRPTKDNFMLVTIEHHTGPPTTTSKCKEEYYTACFNKVKSLLEEYFHGACTVVANPS